MMVVGGGMARTKHKKKKSSGSGSKRGQKYTAGELFVAVLGGAFVILIGAIIVTALLGG